MQPLTINAEKHRELYRGSRWGVVGGGLLGIEIARKLRAAGHFVTLIESAPHLGGLADMWQLVTIVWDRHYHVTLLSDTRLRQFLDELDLSSELRWNETRSGFFTDGQLFSLSNSLEFLRFPPLGLLSKFRFALTILHASRLKNGKALESIPVVDWLRQWSGRHTTEKIWLPLLRAKLGENYRYASAAFIWAVIARMYAARRTGLKKELFGYVRGGYGRILERATEDLIGLGVTVREASRVSQIRSVEYGFDIDYEDGSLESFDQVVVTTAAPLATRICTDLTVEEKLKWNAIRYQGIICASLLLRKPLAHYFVTNITDPAPFTAIIEMTALVNPDEFGGRHLVYLPKYVSPDDPLFEQPDHKIRDEFLAGLKVIHPQFDPEDLLAFRVSRARNVLAISTLNYSENLPPMTTSIPGLYIVNSAHITNGTLNVNETLQLADRAMETLLVGAEH